MDKKYTLVFLVILGSVVVFYFSWLPDPDIGHKSYFPSELGQWINTYGNLRTAVPFLILSTLIEIFVIGDCKNNNLRIVILLILIIIVVIAELGQLFLPRRHFDIEDIFWGIIGSLIGTFIGAFFKNFTKR